MRKFVLWIFIYLLAGFLLTLCFNEAMASTGGKRADELVLSDYVDYFHQTMRPSYAKKAKRLIPPLIQYAQKHNVDPLLMGVVFSFESSWRNFEGDLGERGPGHIMPKKGKPWRVIEGIKYDLSTLDGQIDGACAHMRHSLDSCDTMAQVFAHYGSGSRCQLGPVAMSKMKFRAQYYEKMKKKFRQ